MIGVGAGGVYTVSELVDATNPAHTYNKDEGTFALTINIFDDAPGTATAVVHATAVVTEADVLTGAPKQTAATVGQGSTFNGVVANFLDSYPFNTAADFTATIQWGDGATTAGTVGGSGAAYSVTGSHAYAGGANTYTVTVTLTDDLPGTATATVTNTITVTAADSIVVAPNATPLNTAEGAPFSGPVAAFTDPNAGAVASDFAATIDWGDGSTSVGTVTGGNGGFSVSGTHAYAADENTYLVNMTISEVNVTEADVLTTAQSQPFVTVTEGSAFQGAVAMFNDPFTGSAAGDFHATIDWGDGTTTAGTVSRSGATLTVNGGHTYADEGSYALKVTLTDDDLGTATATANNFATVSEIDSLQGQVVTIAPTAGTPFTGTVANFTDTNATATAADFTATIDWGDGTVTSGLVGGTGGNFVVSGTHTYAAAGSDTLVVTLHDDAPTGASATATGSVQVSSGGGSSGGNGGILLNAVTGGQPGSQPGSQPGNQPKSGGGSGSAPAVGSGGGTTGGTGTGGTGPTSSPNTPANAPIVPTTTTPVTPGSNQTPTYSSAKSSSGSGTVIGTTGNATPPPTTGGSSEPPASGKGDGGTGPKSDGKGGTTGGGTDGGTAPMEESFLYLVPGVGDATSAKVSLVETWSVPVQSPTVEDEVFLTADWSADDFRSAGGDGAAAAKAGGMLLGVGVWALLAGERRIGGTLTEPLKENKERVER